MALFSFLDSYRIPCSKEIYSVFQHFLDYLASFTLDTVSREAK